MLNFLLGILSGILTSLLFWVYKNKISPPKLSFGEEIARTCYQDGSIGFKYIYKNTGKRGLLDISMKVIIKIPGLVENNSNLRQVVAFEMGVHNRFVVDVGKVISNKLIIDMESRKKNNVISNLLRSKIETGEDINVDTLLDINGKSTISIFILGNDELTGARKVFESPQYSKKNIKDGVFNRTTLVVIGKTIILPINWT